MIAEGENKDSWGWFLDILHSVISDNPGKPISFMTDRQKGVLDAIACYFPHSNNRYYVRHMYNNFKAKYPRVKLRDFFWDAARATNVIHFNDALANIRRINKDAYSWVVKIPPTHWSRHMFDESVRSDHVTNNLTESFNAWIGSYRGKLVLTLLENLRRKIMKRIQKRNQKGLGWKTDVPPRVRERLDKLRKDGRHCSLIWAGGDEFEVREESTTYVVHLGRMHCECRFWAINGLPCKHAMACISHKREDLASYCHPYLTKQAYLSTYNGMIHPLPDESVWSKVEHDLVQPQFRMRKPGRPKKNRRREANKPTPVYTNKRSCTLRCMVCKDLGHNKRTCPKVPQSQQRVTISLDKGRNRGNGLSSSQKVNDGQCSSNTLASSHSRSSCQSHAHNISDLPRA